METYPEWKKREERRVWWLAWWPTMGGVLLFALLLAACPQAAHAQALGYSIGNVTLYVNPAKGSNDFSCDGPTVPCATLQGALDKACEFTPFVRHAIKIILKEGTHAWPGADVWCPVVRASSSGAWIWLEGELITATPATGTASGTSTASAMPAFPTRATVTDAGQAWTINDLRGKLMCLGASDALGCWPIASNTATAVTLEGGTLPISGIGSTLSGLGGNVAYTVKDWGTIITGSKSVLADASYPIPATALGESTSETLPYQVGVMSAGPWQTRSFYLSKLKFTPSSGAAIRQGPGTSLAAMNIACVSPASPGNCFQALGDYSVSVVRSVFSGSGVAFRPKNAAEARAVRVHSNLFSGVGFGDFTSSTRSFQAVYNHYVAPAQQVYLLGCVEDGEIAGDLIESYPAIGSIFDTRRAFSKRCHNAVHFDGLNWSGIGSGVAAINAPGRFTWDSTGVASTGTLTGFLAVQGVDLDSRADFLLITPTINATGTGGAQLLAYGTSAAVPAFRTAAQVSAGPCDSTGAAGNATCEMAAGRMAVAAAAADATITNSLVTTSTNIVGTRQTNDGTCQLASIEPDSGSFRVRMTAACTADTVVAWRIEPAGLGKTACNLSSEGDGCVRTP